MIATIILWPATWGEFDAYTNTLNFDPENRMTAFNSAETNTYDGDDHRASIQTSSGTSYYVFDGNEPVLTEDRTGTVTKVITIGLDGIASIHTTSTTFYTWDPQGSLSQKLDSTSAIQYTREYDAFGNVAKTDSDNDNYASFGGQWGYFFDSATGFCQLGHRFYDPSYGRFVTRDPIGYVGGVNAYVYSGNNPSSWMDPLGLWFITIGPGMAGIAPLFPSPGFGLGFGGFINGGITIGSTGIGVMGDIGVGAGFGQEGFEGGINGTYGTGNLPPGASTSTGGFKGGIFSPISGTVSTMGTGTEYSIGVGRPIGVKPEGGIGIMGGWQGQGSYVIPWSAIFGPGGPFGPTGPGGPGGPGGYERNPREWL